MAKTPKKAAAGTAGHPLRFEATVQAGPRVRTLARVADLDLDRVPDPRGDVRVLASAEELARLLDEGYEVHLYGTVRAAPLDPGLVMDDDEAVRWLEEMVEGLPREEGS
ncbi:MAG: hypothetical protein WCA30_11320 [Dermatophilaceae bacterium]